MANTTGKKFGGRTKGTPNRTTSETKELIKDIVNKELEWLPKLLMKLEPNERINAIAKLLPYVLPKQQELSVEVEVKEYLTAEERVQRLKELKTKLEKIEL